MAERTGSDADGRGQGHSTTGRSDTGSIGDIDTMTVSQLRGWLKDHGVSGTSGMRKDDLVKAAVKTMRSDQGTSSASVATGKKSTSSGKSGGAAAHRSTADSSAKKSAQAPTAQDRESTGRAGESAWESGHDDVIDLLLSHHEQIKLLFAQMGKTQGEHREHIWQQLVRLLIIHENIEQQLVHPLSAKRLPDGEDMVESRLQEEEQASQDLAELYSMGIDHPRFDTRLADLRDAVTEHAELEEDEEFGYLRDNVPAEQLLQLAAAAKAAEKAAPARPQPDAPMRASALGDMMPGPLAAIGDRVRDALRDASR